jgi:hypothetical protein
LNKNDFSLVAIRVLALYWIFSTVSKIPMTLFPDPSFIRLFIIAIAFAFPILLWVAAPLFSKWLAGEDSAVATSNLTMDSIESTFVFLLGLFMVFTGLPQLVFDLSSLMQSKSVVIDEPVTSLIEKNYFLLFASLSQIVFGLILVCKPHAILKGAKALQKIQFVK